MSAGPLFELSPETREQTRDRPRWHSMAFLVESMILLVFLAASLAVFIQLFSKSAAWATSAEKLSSAIAAAGNGAERFAANPENTEESAYDGDLRVVTSVEAEKQTGGTLYHATVEVYDDSTLLYTIQTARYVSEVD